MFVGNVHHSPQKPRRAESKSSSTTTPDVVAEPTSIGRTLARLGVAALLASRGLQGVAAARPGGFASSTSTNASVPALPSLPTLTSAALMTSGPAPMAVPAMPPTAVNVLTQHNDNFRLGANLCETLLTPDIVTPDTFGLLFSRKVDGHLYGQPLYVKGLTLPDGSIVNVVFVATMHNTVYAFDADNSAATRPYWHVNLGPSVPASDFGDNDVQQEIGVLSTPVIDIDSKTL